jgi:hypothetical protein
VNIKRVEPLIPSESYIGHSAYIRNVEVEEHLILNDKAIKKISDQPSLLENNAKSISEAYHKAKADGTNPELKALEEQSLKETPKAETEVSSQPEGESNPKSEEEQRAKGVEILDTEKKIAQLEKELRKAPIRPSKGVLSKKQIRIQIKNYNEQLRELKGLKPRKKITDSVLRINLRKFGTEVDETNLPHTERVVLDAIGRLSATDADIANSDGNAKLRMQNALKAKGDSIDQIVTDYISENQLEENMAPELRSAIIDFVEKGDAYKWMDAIKEREAQTDPNAIREDEYYNFGYDQAIELEMTDEEISELENEIGTLNDLTQEEYEQLKQEFSNTEPIEGIDKSESKTDSIKTKSERKAIAEAKIDEIADLLKDFLPSAKGVKKSGIGQDEIIDLVAKAVKALVNTGIDVQDAIKQVKDRLSERFDVDELKDFDIKMNIAKNDLKPLLEKSGITYRQAVFTVNKYLREVKADDVISEEDLREALKAKEAESVRSGYDVKGESVKKTVLTKRAYEGDFRDSVKSELEKFGLTRAVENQEDANNRAKDFINSVGEDAALDSVRNGDVVGGMAAAVFANVMVMNREKALLSTNKSEVEVLNKREADLINEFGEMAKQGGQFNSMINFIYQNTDLGFNVEAKIKEYKDANNGEISAEMEAKFRALDTELKEVNKKLVEAEKRAADAEANQSVKNIQESIERNKKKSYTKSSKDIANNIRKLKSKPFKFTDENGNEINIDTMGVSWNNLVEEIAKAVEKGGEIIDAVSNALNNADWYKSLSNKDKNKLVKQLEEYFAEAEKTEGGLSISTSLIRSLVEGGITDINELTKQVYKSVSQLYPNITEREVRDEITGYGRTVNLSQDEVSRQLRRMKDIGRTISALEDVENKIRPLKSGTQRDKMDAEQRSLKKKLREAMKDLPIDLEASEAALKSQLEATKTRIQNRIEDLQREIDTKIKTPENARTVKEDEELKALKERRDKLKEEHDKIFKDEEFIEAKRLEQTKKRTEQRIEDLQRRLKNGDFTKTQRKAVVADSELIKLRAEKLRIQEEYNKELYKVQLENRTKAEKIKDSIWELWNIPRILMATGEASFVGVQGLKQTISHPINAAKAFKNAFEFFKSEKRTEEWLNEIKSQEWYPILKGSKLALTEPNVGLTAREELFYSGWANNMWDIAGWLFTFPFRQKGKAAHKKAHDFWLSLNPFKAIERASVGYLDTIRVERFLDGMQMLEMKGKNFETDKQDYKDVADAINTMTGRASLGKYGEQAAPILSKIFFSPRNWASGIKSATPYALYHFGKMTPTARKMAIADFSKFLGFTTSIMIMAAAYLNNDDDDETQVELDPRSSDFMKIRLGKTRVDPWGGMQQQVVLSARIMADALMKMLPQIGIGGAIKKGDELLATGVPNRTKTTSGLIAQQAVNKLNPTASLIYNYSSSHYEDGKLMNEYGKEYTLSNELKEKFNPIFWGTVSDLLKDDPNALNGLLAFYAFFGGGVSVYDSDKNTYSIGEEKSQITPNARTIQDKISEESKIKNEEEKAREIKNREEIDKEYKTTEKEMMLRELVEKSRKNKAAIIISELEKISPQKREKTLDRWYEIDVVPKSIYKIIEVKNNQIKLVE